MLREVDRKTSNRHKQAIDKHHDDRAHIFKYFIKGVRDQTIKEFRSGLFSLDDSLSSPMAVYTSAMAFEPHTAMSMKELGLHIGAPLPYALRDGPYKGRDVWGVIEEAHMFWDDYLTKVEIDLQDN